VLSEWLFATGAEILYRFDGNSYYIRPSTFCLNRSSCFNPGLDTCSVAATYAQPIGPLVCSRHTQTQDLHLRSSNVVHLCCLKVRPVCQVGHWWSHTYQKNPTDICPHLSTLRETCSKLKGTYVQRSQVQGLQQTNWWSVKQHFTRLQVSGLQAVI